MRIVKKRKPDILMIVIMLAWISVIVGVIWYTLSTTAGTGERRLPVYSVATDERLVSLTFNCAWGTEGLDELLSLLDKEEIKCTFFFVGEFVQRNPEAVRKIYNKGHEIGNHSMYHTDPVQREYAEIVSDINACNEQLLAVTGSRALLYRAPSGSYDNKTVEAAESLGMTAVQWDVDSIDWKNPSAEKIISRVTQKVTDGSIVLFHLGKENTLEALPEIIRLLKKEGYRFSETGDMLLTGEAYIDNAGRQHPAESDNSSLEK